MSKMMIVGERINSTRSKINEAIASRDAEWLIKEARQQIEAGADYIDVNCAVTSGDEVEEMEWAVNVIQGAIKHVNLCVDSPNHLAIERALSVYKAGGHVIINSITLEDERINAILPLALKYKTKLVALTMSGSGMPSTAYERLEIAAKILDRVKKENFDPENLYFDALIRPISTEPEQAREFLKAIPLIKGLGAGVKTICGLSNVSFGLPDRKVINAVFLSMAAQAGLDAAIIDPTEKLMASSLAASHALLGADDYCGEYIKAFRDGKLI